MPIIDLQESDTYQNKANLKPDFIKTLETTYKGQMRERYLLGKWAAFEGLVHPEFDTARHVLKREVMLDVLQKCRDRHVKVQSIEGYDFGIVTPTCYMLGFVDDYGRVFILDGFYHPNFDVMQHANVIREIRARYHGLFSMNQSLLIRQSSAESLLLVKPSVALRSRGFSKTLGLICGQVAVMSYLVLLKSIRTLLARSV